MPVRDIQFRRPDEGNIIKDVYDSSDPKGIDRKNGWSIIDGYILPGTVMEDGPAVLAVRSEEHTDALPIYIIKDVYDSSDPKGIDRKNGWSIIDGYILPGTVMEDGPAVLAV